jgi:hypothetical protein
MVPKGNKVLTGKMSVTFSSKNRTYVYETTRRLIPEHRELRRFFAARASNLKNKYVLN